MGACLLVAAAQAQAAIVYVDDSAPAGGLGTSWTAAFPTLNAALAVARSGDEVRVARGTYFPTPTGDRAATFSVPAGVSIVGGFRGAFEGKGDPNEWDPETHPTVLSGAIGSSAVTDNSYCVLTLSGSGDPRLVEGVTIEAGYAASAEAPIKSGAGVRIVDATVTFRTVVVRQNSALESGAGIWCQYATITVQDSIFQANGAVGGLGVAGGAIDVTGGSLVVHDCIFSENSNRTGGHIAARNATVALGASLLTSGLASATVTQGGGALFLDACDTSIVDCTLSGNQCLTTFAGGGAIDAVYGSLLIEGCLFSSNSARSGGAVRSRALAGHMLRDSTFQGNLSVKGGFAVHCLGIVHVDGCTFVENTALPSTDVAGGAIGVFDPDSSEGLSEAQLICSRSTFLNNSATNRRGGACYADRPVVFTACRFLGNSALTGGAIHAQFVPTTTFQSCLFSGNTAGSGGGIYCFGAGLWLSNCTVAGNKATTLGGGVMTTGLAAPVRIDNSILWGNLQGTASTFQAQLRDDQAGTPILSATTVQGLPPAYPGFGNLGSNPLFVDPDGADGVLGTLDDDLHLGTGSPAIDSGITAAVGGDTTDLDQDSSIGEYLPHDIDGMPRFADDAAAPNGGCGAGAPVDRGAFERPGTPGTPVRGDANEDGRVDGADLTSLLAAWGAATPCEPLDFDRSGSVNVADLVTLLGTLWGLESEGTQDQGGRE
jgi:predicted outer membrane repeat protein